MAGSVFTFLRIERIYFFNYFNFNIFFVKHHVMDIVFNRPISCSGLFVFYRVCFTRTSCLDCSYLVRTERRMDFSTQSIRFQEEIRKEISRLEHEILRLREMERLIGTFLESDTQPSAAPFPKPENLLPRSKPAFLSPPSFQAHSASIGDEALRILSSDNRDFTLDEITDLLSSGSGAPNSRDLKNAVRVALVRRKDQVLHTGRGLYRFRSTEPLPSPE